MKQYEVQMLIGDICVDNPTVAKAWFGVARDDLEASRALLPQDIDPPPECTGIRILDLLTRRPIALKMCATDCINRFGARASAVGGATLS